MKKLLLCAAASLVVGVAGLKADPVDMVVLLDTSQGMLPYFNDATNYLLKDLLTEQLRVGDTFHLLSFSARPEVEISRQIQGPDDVNDIVNHILLLQPLGRYTDLVLAVKYLYQYTIDLPLGSDKEILILTEGIHNPPPGSSFPIKVGPGGKDLSDNRAQIMDTAEEIKRRGWDVHFLQFPLNGAEALGSGARSSRGSTASSKAGERAGAGGDALFRDFATAIGSPIEQYQTTPKADLSHVATGAPGLVFPGNLGTVGFDVTVPFGVRNYGDSPILVGLDQVLYDGADLLQNKVAVPIKAEKSGILRARLRLPVTLKPGANTISIDLVFSNSAMIFPHRGDLSFTLKKGILGSGRASFYLLVVLFVVVLIACAILVLILIRRIVASLTAPPAPSAIPQHIHYDARRAPLRSLRPVEMKVTGQNPHIGSRNIHAIGSGTRKAVGGGGSSFLVYLYPLPPRIAEISFDGDRYTFTPLREELFPDLRGPLADCLGREIRVRTKDKRELRIVFKAYVSPLEELNQIMHLVDKPGVSAASRR